MFGNKSESDLEGEFLELLKDRATLSDISKLKEKLNAIEENKRAEFLNNTQLLHSAVAFAHAKAVELFLTVKGVDVNKTLSYEGAPLHIAMTQVHQFTDDQSGHRKGEMLKIVKSLVDAGANVNVRDKSSSETPLLWVFKRGNAFRPGTGEFEDYRDIAVFLIQNGAKHSVEEADNTNLASVASKYSFKLWQAVEEELNRLKNANKQEEKQKASKDEKVQKPTLKRKTEEHTEEDVTENRSNIKRKP